MDEKTETKFDRFKSFAKEKAVEIGVGVLTVGIAGWTLYNKVKTNQNNTELYGAYLQDRREIQREGIEAYKAGLPPINFNDEID